MTDDIKNYVFEVLPDDSRKWIVIAWGKIVNERTGSYEQEIILKKYSENDPPSQTWDLRDISDLFFCRVNLGSLRVLSPGTIIQNQKIIHFAHEYLEKREIQIQDPQSLLKMPFRILYDLSISGLERFDLKRSIDKIETRLLEGRYLNVLIPCNVIADYYYYGDTYLIKAILEGRLSMKFRNGNDVFNPKTLGRIKSTTTDKVAVYVEIQRKMSFRDEFKIARLAHDYYFRSKCLDIYTNIAKGKVNESYIDTDLPVNEPITLSVYGVEINNNREKCFLVHSISKCSSKAPFDLIFADKNFIGKKQFGNEGNANLDDLDESLLRLSSKKGINERRKGKLEKGNKKNIGVGKPHWNSVPEGIPYDKDQLDNFPKDAAINAKDFSDPKKLKEISEILHNFGLADGLTTNPNRKGSAYNLQLNLLARGPVKPKPYPPTEAFEIIEKLTLLLEISLTARLYSLTSKIRCPVVEGIDKYSAFPVDELIAEAGAKLNDYLNFCFMNIRENHHTQHRRIYIKELVVNGHVFYIIDVEPKYKIEDEQKKFKKFISSFGVIFSSNKSLLDDATLKDILKSIVTTHKTLFVKWEFLKDKFKFQYLRIPHRSDQRSFDLVSEFIIRMAN